MKLCVVLAFLALAAVGDSLSPPIPDQSLRANGNPRLCEGNGRMVRQFSDRKEDIMMPCKYKALSKTKCGRYQVSITPSNVYLHPKFQLDALWLDIRDLRSSRDWEGRTDNTIAVKFLNGKKDALFNQKGGMLSTEDLLVFGKDSFSTWAEEKDGAFRITFVPWDPNNDASPGSSWSFECLSDRFRPSRYPKQICGGPIKMDVANKRENLDLEDRQQVINYYVFTDTSITQTNPKCGDATRIMTEVCTKRKQRREAIKTCSQILSSYKHTKCLAKHFSDPMDVFVDCLNWACGGDAMACQRVGYAIDMCMDLQDGDLAQRMEDAKCYYSVA